MKLLNELREEAKDWAFLEGPALESNLERWLDLLIAEGYSVAGARRLLLVFKLEAERRWQDGVT